MKFFNTKTATPPASNGKEAKSAKPLVLLLATTCAMLVTIGALNGGAAPTASVWDGVTTYLTNMLGSTFVIVLAIIALVGLIWQVSHGRGYGGVSYVLGVLALALIGPGMVTAAASATRDPGVELAAATAAVPGATLTPPR